MVRRPDGLTGPYAGRPRARGDGSGRMWNVSPGTRSAPRTRGWFLVDGPLGVGRVVGPAHAGMVPVRRRLSRTRRRRPRARGDGSWIRNVTSRGSSSAPRTRGWFAPARMRNAGRSVGPAHAGMVPHEVRDVARDNGRPRARGDGSASTACQGAAILSAPRTRGWFFGLVPAAGLVAVGPAHAGMVHEVAAAVDHGGRRPRARGDGSRPYAAPAATRRSAPRTRGWFARVRRPQARGEVGPAHAGMVPGPSTMTRPRSRRPRARGDGSVTTGLSFGLETSAPRTRGWFSGPARQSLPCWGSAPRTRGWFVNDDLPPERFTVGPAHAGMVLELVSLPPWAWSSAPRTRGWSDPGRPDVDRPGVGPAHAGTVSTAAEVDRR